MCTGTVKKTQKINDLTKHPALALEHEHSCSQSNFQPLSETAAQITGYNLAVYYLLAALLISAKNLLQLNFQVENF